jgi:hypothetical protein
VDSHKDKHRLVSARTDASGAVTLDLPAREIPLRDERVALTAEGKDLDGRERRLIAPVVVTEVC